MLIVNCNKTSETAERLENYSNAIKGNFLINLGNSSLKEENYKDYIIINKVEGIKNCVNKKDMFRLLKKGKVSSLDYLNLKNPIDLIKGFMILYTKSLVFRKERKLKIINNHIDYFTLLKNYDYATIKENKVLEYRVLMFKDYPFRILLKLNKTNDFKLKQENCKFISVNLIREDIVKECIKATKSIGIDLAGIDILINNKFEPKIIEINSGMALCGKSIRELIKSIKEYY